MQMPLPGGGHAGANCFYSTPPACINNFCPYVTGQSNWAFDIWISLVNSDDARTWRWLLSRVLVLHRVISRVPEAAGSVAYVEVGPALALENRK